MANEKLLSYLLSLSLSLCLSLELAGYDNTLLVDGVLCRPAVTLSCSALFVVLCKLLTGVQISPASV